MKINETVINYAVYESATEYLGHAEVQLPEINQLTEEISGAGISGKIDAVIIGHIEAMKMTINFRTLTKDTFKLATPVNHTIDLRVAQQERDSGTGQIIVRNIKHALVIKPIKLNPGKVAPASSADASGEYAVTYFATFIDGKKVMEIDPLNYIYNINGTDYLKQVRKALGK